MDTEIISSFFELLQRGRRVAIVLRQKPSADSLATALGWQVLLQQTNHEVSVVTADGMLEQLKFLPGSNDVQTTIAAVPLIVELDTKDATVGKVRYEVADNKLQIFVQPKSGSLENATVTTHPGETPFDLILSIGAPTRESWGSLFDQHRDLFLHAPTVTLDNHPGHQRYGQLNLVDVASPSLAGLSYQIWHEHQPDDSWMTTAVATCWYTGLVAATKKFSSPQVTPQLLNLAGLLLALGAQRDDIMANLYKNRSVANVRLWGMALATLVWEESLALAWCTITRSHVLQSGGNDSDLEYLVQEVAATSPQADVAILFYEHSPEETRVYLAVPGTLDALALLRQYQPSGDIDAATATLAKGLPQSQIEVLEAIRQVLAGIPR
jgi:nanoRNase/pAp phosphatase (c-di-AMP/oligoRNAs hydrolase)